MRLISRQGMSIRTIKCSARSGTSVSPHPRLGEHRRGRGRKTKSHRKWWSVKEQCAPSMA